MDKKNKNKYWLTIVNLIIVFVLGLNTFININISNAWNSDTYYSNNETSPNIDIILLKINNINLISSYIKKLENIEWQVDEKKQNIYKLIINSFQKRYDELDKVEKQKNINTYMSDISSKVGKIIIVDNNFEFNENELTKKVLLSTIIKIKNDPDFLRTVLKTYDLSKQILIVKNGEYIISLSWFDIEKKLTPDKILSISKMNIPEPIDGWNWVSIFKTNNSYYALDTTKFSYSILPKQDFYLSQYSNLSNPKDWVIIDTKNGIKILNNYKIYTLDINVPETNKKLVLQNIAEDKIHFFSWSIKNETQRVYMDITNITKKIIKDKKTEQEKIYTIYKWIADNISYDKNVSNILDSWTVDLNALVDTFDKNIFSWIWTFEYRSGVCQWYTKLFAYMLSIAWIKDIEIEYWNANNGKWYIAHAWMRIGLLYYDVTFDDNNNWIDKSFIWYALPYNIMYATRSYSNEDYWKTASQDELKNKLTQSLKDISNDYNIYDYKIFTYNGIN